MSEEVSDFFKGKKCGICGKDATMAMFGQYLCGEMKCYLKARSSRECIGKSMKHNEN